MQKELKGIESLERLQKIISQSGIASRREAERMILSGRVAVNGTVVTELGTKADAGDDAIWVDGKRIAGERHVYFMLYKPKGVITSAKDERGRKTVVDLLSEVKQRVYPVGRLDYQTEGLLLLTNDGALTNRLIHPRYEIYKTYIAKVRGIPPEESLDRLRAGIRLEDGMTAPAVVGRLPSAAADGLVSLEITIHEGRNRQIRRMCEAIGYPVQSLKRVKFASLTLAGLRRGQYRELTKEEVVMLEAIE